MAYAVLPQKSMFEVHSMIGSNQADINFSTDHYSRKRALFPFSHSLVGFKKQSDLQASEIYGTKASTSILMCKKQQAGFFLDINSEGSPQECESNRYMMGVETKFSGHSSKHALDGPSIENDEKTNNEILQSFCSQGKILDGAKMVDVMTRRKQIPHFPSCIKLIKGLLNAERTDKAVKVLQLMVMTGGTPDVITYNMLVGGLCRKRHLDAAVDVLEGMSSSGCPPDIITYNTIVRAMCDHGKFDDAIQFWKDQLRKGCPPYIITHTILIGRVCEHFGATRALEIMEDIAVEGCYPDLVTYNSMISLTCKTGNYEDVMLIVRNLLSHGIKPNVVTYNTLLHSLCVYGCWDGVDGILLLMSETSNPPTVVTCNILINSLCRHGLLDRAIDFFNQMVLNDCCLPDIITYNTLTRALCKEGMVDEAIRTLYSLRNNTNCPPTVITYNIVFDGLSKQGCMDKVMEVYKHMVECGHCPDDVTYRCLLWGFCRADLVEEAIELLKVIGSKMRRMIREKCYRFMIHRLCQKKEVDSAVQVVQMLISSRSKYDPLLCPYLVQGIHAAGMIDEAIELRHKLIEKKLYMKRP
ncbi:hypothetical protein OROMI_002425 [Orobanche minor]